MIRVLRTRIFLSSLRTRCVHGAYMQAGHCVHVAYTQTLAYTGLAYTGHTSERCLGNICVHSCIHGCVHALRTHAAYTRTCVHAYTVYCVHAAYTRTRKHCVRASKPAYTVSAYTVYVRTRITKELDTFGTILTHLAHHKTPKVINHPNK